MKKAELGETVFAKKRGVYGLYGTREWGFPHKVLVDGQNIQTVKNNDEKVRLLHLHLEKKTCVYDLRNLMLLIPDAR